MLRAWNAVDPVYYHCTRLRYIRDSEQQNTLFRVRITRYKGTSVMLQDGTVIRKNDLLLKIHLHNARIFREIEPIKSKVKRTLYIYQLVKEALPRLAQYIVTLHNSREIKGIIGITTLNRGANRLGFETFPIRNKIYRAYKKGTFLLIHRFANNTSSKDPVYLFMSKGQLINRYKTH